MVQSYVNIIQCMQDLNIEMLNEYTKLYNKTQLILFLKKNYGDCTPFVAEQLALIEKSKKKLPEWFSQGCFFTKKSLEQSSSIPLAKFKASLLQGKLLVDLSAGLGVDDVAFSTTFNRVIGVDVDPTLNSIVRHNYERLNIHNVTRVDATAEAFLIDNPIKADAYYIDSDRRPSGSTQTFSLIDATPNVLDIAPALVDQGAEVLLKLSPMVDVSYVFKTFDHIKRLIVVGFKNEVKEVLVLLNSQANTVSRNIEAVQVNEDGKVEFNFSPTPNRLIRESHIDNLFFYEPSNMIVKAGLSVDYAECCGLSLVAKNSHYATGAFIDSYFGRCFRVVNHCVFNKSGIKQYVKQHGITKANVSARNFVSSVDEIRKSFNLEDGGDDYLFFTQDAAKNKLFWHCKKINL
jgi:hypothetical protein